MWHIVGDGRQLEHPESARSTALIAMRHDILAGDPVEHPTVDQGAEERRARRCRAGTSGRRQMRIGQTGKRGVASYIWVW